MVSRGVRSRMRPLFQKMNYEKKLDFNLFMCDLGLSK